MLKKKYVIFLITALIIFFIDRLSKNYILNIAEVEGNVDIFVNSYLNIFLVWNTGIGFGLLSFDQSLIYNSIKLLIIAINLYYFALFFWVLQEQFYERTLCHTTFTAKFNPKRIERLKIIQQK